MANDVRNNIFYATRTDGLGERLRAILNAIALANKFSGRFYFSWTKLVGVHEKFHSTGNVDSVFDPYFIENHFIEWGERKSLKLLSYDQFIEEGFNKENIDGVEVNKVHLAYRNFFEDDFFYEKAFKSIRFNDKVEDARIEAYKVSLDEKSIAIHLRSGDIVYGIFRYSNLFYDKIVPQYIVEALIKKLQKDGYKVFIFGQDYDFCKVISKSSNAIFVDEIKDTNYDVHQSAIFDITLMSRCDRIVAGSSGFAVLASWINNKKIDSYKSFLNTKEIENAFIGFSDDVGLLFSPQISSLSKSFALSHYLNEFESSLSLHKKKEIVRKCLEMDADNIFYKIFYASLLYDENKGYEADMLLLNELEKNSDEVNNNIKDFIIRANYKGETGFTQFLDCFKSAMNNGSLVAAALVLMYLQSQKEVIELLSFNKIIDNSSDEDLGYSLLFEKIKETR